MADIYREDIATIDLAEPLARESVGKTLATGDKLANRVGVRVRRAGKDVSLTGHAATGYFIRPDLQTVVIPGKVSGNTAYVDIPQACMTERGPFSLAVKVSGTDVTQTVRVLDGSLILTQTDALIDPGDSIPTLDDIYAQISAMEQATAETEEAIEAARQGATAAQAAALILMRTASPAIVQTTVGDGVVAVSDSAERSISSLSVYGKTTQDGTPTPQAPVPLVNVGSGGSIGVQVRGKNLVDLSKATNSNADTKHEVNGNELRIYTTTQRSYSGCRFPAMHLQKGVRYTLSASVTEIVSGTVRIGLRKVADNVFTGWFIDFSEPGRKSISYTPAEDLNAYLSPLVTMGTTENGDATFADIQFEASGAATAFESYKDGGALTALTPNGLPGIPVSSGGNYIDSTGQQWICDEIDFARKVYIKRVQTVTLDGTVSMARETTSNGINQFYRKCADAGAYRFTICNYAPYGASGPGICYMSGDGYFVLRMPDALQSTTADEFKAMRTANPLVFMYVLATPIETPIPPDELTGSTSTPLSAQYPYTTAMNDAYAGMSLSYVADTKLYIDNKFSALAAASLNA